jgi:acyl carrier protein
VMSKDSQSIVMEIVEVALDLESGVIQASSDSASIEEWDSLGQLSILVALDTHFGGKVSNLTEMADVDSIQAILAVLKKNGIC